MSKYKWELICVKNGESLYDTVKNKKEWWIMNAYSYNGNEHDIIIDSEYSASGTSSIDWSTFTNELYKSNVKQYENWDLFSYNLFDVTPYLHHTIEGTDWPCWVQFTNTKISFNSYPKEKSVFNSNNLFQNSGWYCITHHQSSFFIQHSNSFFIQDSFVYTHSSVYSYPFNSNFMNIHRNSYLNFWSPIYNPPLSNSPFWVYVICQN